MVRGKYSSASPVGFAGVHEIIVFLKKIDEQINCHKTAVDGEEIFDKLAEQITVEQIQTDLYGDELLLLIFKAGKTVAMPLSLRQRDHL